jgi:DNA-directed RNA polymerase subunit RPC12/RpoP
MRHQAAAPASSLPSLMMPCPVCAGRMVYSGRRPIAVDVEDTVYACRRCGAELIRTSVRKAAKPDAEKTPAAA